MLTSRRGDCWSTIKVRQEESGAHVGLWPHATYIVNVAYLTRAPSSFSRAHLSLSHARTYLFLTRAPTSLSHAHLTHARTYLFLTRAPTSFSRAHLPLSRLIRFVAPPGRQCVHLVEEQDAGLGGPRPCKQLTDRPLALAHILRRGSR